jgi:hypothetical protein
MFMHKLALAMGRTVGELSATMTTDELSRWMAFHKSSPIGAERLDYLFARLCTLVCDVAGAKKFGGGRFQMDDFILWKPKDVRTPIDFMRARFGGKVIKKRG